MNKHRPLKTAVAVAPVFDFYFTRHRFSTLGSEIVCQLLQKNGCESHFFNFPIHCKKGQTVSLPAALSFLRPHLIENETGRMAFFTRYQRFGPETTICVRQILDVQPDIVFIACFAFCYADAALELAAGLRAAKPELAIAAGGAGVSAYPEFFIRNPNIDFALTGEAETCIPFFLKTIKSDPPDFAAVPNLFWKNKGSIIPPKIKRQTRAGEIAFILKKTHETKKSVYYTTALSRGCPKKCRFCSNFLCHGREFRIIPISVIEKQLAETVNELKTPSKPIVVNFEDDNLLLAPEYFLSVLTLFKKKIPKVSFLSENGMDYTRLSPALLKKLIDLGVIQFNLSIASTHAPTLASEQRETMFPRYEKIIRLLAQNNMQSISYFICGFKQDAKQTIVSDIAYLARQATRIGISLFYPVPGIPDFTDKSLFDAPPTALCAGSSAYPWNQSLSTAEMITAFRLCRFVNLLKDPSKTEAEAMLIQKICRERQLFTLVKKGRKRLTIPVPNADNDMIRLFFQAFPC